MLTVETLSPAPQELETCKNLISVDINSCTRTKHHEDQGEPLRKSVSKQPRRTVSHFPNTHPVDSETQLNMSKALIF